MDIKAIIIGTLISLALIAYLFFSVRETKVIPPPLKENTYIIIDQQNNPVGTINMRGTNG